MQVFCINRHTQRFIKVEHWVLSNQDDVLIVPPVHRVCPSPFCEKWRLKRRHFFICKQVYGFLCKGCIYMKKVYRFLSNGIYFYATIQNIFE